MEVIYCGLKMSENYREASSDAFGLADLIQIPLLKTVGLPNFFCSSRCRLGLKDGLVRGEDQHLCCTVHPERAVLGYAAVGAGCLRVSRNEEPEGQVLDLLPPIRIFSRCQMRGFPAAIYQRIDRGPPLRR
jgi:hypothetical protein